MNIVHRDVKSANIFMNKDEAKLGDMNVSKISQMGLVILFLTEKWFDLTEIYLF